MNVLGTYFTYNFNYSILFLLIRPQQKRAKEHREMISRIRIWSTYYYYWWLERNC